MKRRRILVCALLSILIATTAGTGLVSLTNANFKPAPTIPITTKPIVTLLLPLNGTNQENDAKVVFNVSMPKDWGYGSSQPPVIMGTIRNVTCTLDQNVILYNDTVYGKEHIVDGPDPYVYYNVRSIVYSQNVSGLALGQHTLTISVAAVTFFFGAYNGESGYNNYDVSTSVTSTFTVVAPPAVTNLSIENKTYNTPFLPLTFNLNETTSWLGYSLDNRANVTLNGNVTLTDLTESNHSLVVYANDTFGNMGKSDTVSFNVTLPAPTPSPSPSPSPTQQPTLEPTPAPPLDSWTSEWIPIAIVAAAVALGVSVLVYIRKPKK